MDTYIIVKVYQREFGEIIDVILIVWVSELSTGRMDPRVGSGRVGSGRVGSGRVTILPDFGGSGRVSISDFLVFNWLFLGTWIDMNLRKLHSDWLIFYDI